MKSNMIYGEDGIDKYLGQKEVTCADEQRRMCSERVNVCSLLWPGVPVFFLFVFLLVFWRY